MTSATDQIGPKAFLLSTSLAAAAFLFPPLGLLALVFFAFVPGCALLVALRARLRPIGFLFTGVALSYALTVSLTYWLSLLLGYGRLSIALAFAAASMPLLLVRTGLPSPARIWANARDDAPAAALSVAVFVLVLAVSWNSLMKDVPAGVANGGWNWSDFLLHYSIIESVNAGNFPPQTPFAAGTPLVYHWFADFLTAINSAFTGVPSIVFARVEPAFFAALLAGLSYSLARLFAGSRSASLLAAVLVVFGGGFGWLKLAELWGTEPLHSLIAKHSFDNSWEQDWGPWRIPSILGTAILAWRASAAGLPLLLAALLLGITAFSKRPFRWDLLALAGLVAGLSLEFHFFVAPVSFLLLGMHALAKAWPDRERFRLLLRSALAMLPGLLAAAPFIPQLLERGASRFEVRLGWEAPLSSPEDFMMFYVQNLGLPLLLAVLGLAFARVEDKKYLVAWALTMFLIPNLFLFVPVLWDMSKFFHFAWMPLAILAGAFVARLPKPAWPLVLAPCVLSPLLIAAHFVTSDLLALSTSQLEAAEWIRSNTPERAIFVTDAWINMPTDVAGRLRLMTFGTYVLTLGIPTDERVADIRKVYCGSHEEAVAAMRKYNATYVLSGYNSQDCANTYRDNPMLELVYDRGGVQIYQLKPSAFTMHRSPF